MHRVRIVHSSDFHLDASLAPLGAPTHLGARLRHAQRQTVVRILDAAREWPADMVLLSGDLFDGNPSLDTIVFLREAFEQIAPIPVYIAPGNRDPFTALSPYAVCLWPDNVFIFTPGNWQSMDHATLPLTLHGIGCDDENTAGDWFPRLSIPPDKRMHLAMAHGSANGHLPASAREFAPFDPIMLARNNLAYCALGHFHDPMEIRGHGPTVFAYPGVPQGRNFSECGNRVCFRVEITWEDHQLPQVQVLPQTVQTLDFITADFLQPDAQRVPAFLNELKQGIQAGHEAMARVHLRGHADPSLNRCLEMLTGKLEGPLLHVELCDETAPLPLVRVRPENNSCMAALARQWAARIQDAPDHPAALHERQAWLFSHAACFNDALLPQYTRSVSA